RTLPIDIARERPLTCGLGWAKKRQSRSLPRLAGHCAASSTSGTSSLPPASNNSTPTSGFSASRRATTEPAEPVPQTTKSYCAAICFDVMALRLAAGGAYCLSRCRYSAVPASGNRGPLHGWCAPPATADPPRPPCRSPRRFGPTDAHFSAMTFGATRSPYFRGRLVRRNPMLTTPTAYPDVATREEWLAVRKKLLAREREVTHLRDAVNAERRRLPMV